MLYAKCQVSTLRVLASPWGAMLIQWKQCNSPLTLEQGPTVASALPLPARKTRRQVSSQPRCTVKNAMGADSNASRFCVQMQMKQRCRPHCWVALHRAAALALGWRRGGIKVRDKQGYPCAVP